MRSSSLLPNSIMEQHFFIENEGWKNWNGHDQLTSNSEKNNQQNAGATD